MKRLALLRHAKSSWDDAALGDFDRPLNPRGRQAAGLIGAEMRRRDLAFDRVLASPARRIFETIAQVESSYGASLQPRFEPQIYEATPRALVELLGGVDDEVHRLLLVGHNPGLQALACTLAAGSDPLRHSVAEHFPTAALLLLELDVTTWQEIGPGTGAIIDFLKPRDLKSA